MKTCIIVCFFIMFCLTVSAQKANQFNSWWYYSGSYKIKERISLNTMYSWSRHDFVKYWQISKLGVGGTYELTKNVNLGAGYEWGILFPYGAHPVPENRIEHRILERLLLKQKVNKIAIHAALDIEQIFVTSFIKHRSRVRFGFKVPLLAIKNNTQKLSFSFFNQVFLNFGKHAKGKYFGQNRIFTAFYIPIDKAFNLSLGYMNQYIVINDSRIENDHTLMVGLFHKLDFRRKNI